MFLLLSLFFLGVLRIYQSTEYTALRNDFNESLEENVGHLMIAANDEHEVRRLKEAMYKSSAYDTLYYYGNIFLNFKIFLHIILRPSRE